MILSMDGIRERRIKERCLGRGGGVWGEKEMVYLLGGNRKMRNKTAIVLS